MAIARRRNGRFPDPGRAPQKLGPDEVQELYGLSAEPVELVRREEEATITSKPREAGAVRLRKRVDRLLARADVSRQVEKAMVERKPAEAGDSGQVETLPDGSISIPIFEEEIVVTKRMVVRERLIVRKERRSEQVSVPVELKRERVEIEADPAVRDRIKKG
jgi:uncharacterized protein (TIGR02271 family)